MTGKAKNWDVDSRTSPYLGAGDRCLVLSSCRSDSATIAGSYTTADHQSFRIPFSSTILRKFFSERSYVFSNSGWKKQAGNWFFFLW